MLLSLINLRLNNCQVAEATDISLLPLYRPKKLNMNTMIPLAIMLPSKVRLTPLVMDTISSAMVLAWKMMRVMMIGLRMAKSLILRLLKERYAMANSAAANR